MKARSIGKLKVLDGQDAESLSIAITASLEIVLQFGELLGWLTQALQVPNGESFPVWKSWTTFKKIESDDELLHFRFEHHGIDNYFSSFRGCPPSCKPCWLPLFQSVAIVDGFRIPPRGSQRGLELDFDHLISLCGIDYPVDRDGRIILVGLATILLPVEVLSDGSIQWHLINAQSADRLQSKLRNLGSSVSVFTVKTIEQFGKPLTEPHVISQDEKSAEPLKGWTAFVNRLRETRHFLGWCEVVENLLGTIEGQYESVAWTNTSEVRTSRTPSMDTFSFGTSGKGIFGASFSRTFNIKNNRDERYPLTNRAMRFWAALDNHKDEQVILWDPEERRAWIVPFLSVLLHMVILRLKRDGYHAAIPYANVGNGGSAEALSVLRQHRTMQLQPDSFGNGHRLEDVTTLLIYALQNAYPSNAASTYRGRSISGHELMDLVTCESPFRLKKHSLKWPRGGWPYLTRDVQIVLFSRGMGEVLRPNSVHTGEMCPSWKTLPKGADLLAAPIKSLLHLATRNGREKSAECLMEGYKWHSPRDSFTYCCVHRERSSATCKCEPLQHLKRVSGFDANLSRFIKARNTNDTNNVQVAMSLAKGAVIFGESRALRSARELSATDWKIPADAFRKQPEHAGRTVAPRSPISVQIQNQIVTDIRPGNIGDENYLLTGTQEQLPVVSTMSEMAQTQQCFAQQGIMRNSMAASGGCHPLGLSLLLSQKPLKHWNRLNRRQSREDLRASYNDPPSTLVHTIESTKPQFRIHVKHSQIHDLQQDYQPLPDGEIPRIEREHQRETAPQDHESLQEHEHVPDPTSSRDLDALGDCEHRGIHKPPDTLQFLTSHSRDYSTGHSEGYLR